LPASVLVSRDGRTRLCDALVASSALMQRGFELSAAELAYRAPEQVYASTAPEPSTDVFIAAILLWELVSGRRLLSGPKDVIERKLLEHDLPAATAALRSDCPLSRGLLELLDSSLAAAPHQRPPTPGSLATALERCGHAVASHAEVAAFVAEFAGQQLDRVATLVRVAEGSVAPPAMPEASEPALTPSASSPAVGSGVRPALSSGVTARSLADSVALALERHRASGEFAAFSPATGAAPGASSLDSLAPRPAPARAAFQPRSAPPVPLPRPADLPDAGFADEEKTIVHRAVTDPGASRRNAKSSAPVRLAPKRALLAAMASVVLLIQLWVLSLARSHQEPKASPPPLPSVAGKAHEPRGVSHGERHADTPTRGNH
jgi:hypothetical protein